MARATINDKEILLMAANGEGETVIVNGKNNKLVEFEGALFAVDLSTHHVKQVTNKSTAPITTPDSIYSINGSAIADFYPECSADGFGEYYESEGSTKLAAPDIYIDEVEKKRAFGVVQYNPLDPWTEPDYYTLAQYYKANDKGIATIVPGTKPQLNNIWDYSNSTAYKDKDRYLNNGGRTYIIKRTDTELSIGYRMTEAEILLKAMVYYGTAWVTKLIELIADPTILTDPIKFKNFFKMDIAELDGFHALKTYTLKDFKNTDGVIPRRIFIGIQAAGGGGGGAEWDLFGHGGGGGGSGAFWAGIVSLDNGDVKIYNGEGGAGQFQGNQGEDGTDSILYINNVEQFRIKAGKGGKSGWWLDAGNGAAGGEGGEATNPGDKTNYYWTQFYIKGGRGGNGGSFRWGLIMPQPGNYEEMKDNPESQILGYHESTSNLTWRPKGFKFYTTRIESDQHYNGLNTYWVPYTHSWPGSLPAGGSNNHGGGGAASCTGHGGNCGHCCIVFTIYTTGAACSGGDGSRGGGGGGAGPGIQGDKGSAAEGGKGGDGYIILGF